MQVKNISENAGVILRKLVCYTAGLFLIALGINVAKTAGLGISPVSSTPYAIELIWGIELGRATAIVLFTLMFVQILLLRRDYKVINLLQFFVLSLFSFFVTATSRKYFVLSWLPDPSCYVMSLIYTLASAAVIGTGVSLYLIPKWVPMPPEGLAVAITQKWKNIPIHNAKNFVDISLVSAAIILSLIFGGKIEAVREGTIISALLVGRFVGIANKLYKEKLLSWVGK